MRARTGTAQLPLHGGKAPAWLFSRMVQLAREISIHIVSEFGPDEMLRRLSDHESPDRRSPDQRSPDHRSPDRR